MGRPDDDSQFGKLNNRCVHSSPFSVLVVSQVVLSKSTTSLIQPGYFRRLHRHHLRWYYLWSWQEDRGYRASRSEQLESHLLGSYRSGHLYSE
jgi:hypothetical protein